MFFFVFFFCLVFFKRVHTFSHDDRRNIRFNTGNRSTDSQEQQNKCLHLQEDHTKEQHSGFQLTNKKFYNINVKTIELANVRSCQFDLDEWTLTIGRLTSKIQKLDVNRPIVNVH
jgi:hypothetical protein